jgi:hypothetical protein
LSCKGPGIVAGKKKPADLPLNVPVYVVTDPFFLNDSIKKILKQRKYRVIEKEEQERLMKEAILNLFAANKQNSTDKDEIARLMENAPTAYYTLQIKCSLNRAEPTLIDSISWTILRFPPGRKAPKGSLSGNEVQPNGLSVVLRRAIDSLTALK